MAHNRDQSFITQNRQSDENFRLEGKLLINVNVKRKEEKVNIIVSEKGFLSSSQLLFLEFPPS